MIVSKTPFRISFFGGGTDYPKWYLKYGGRVISTSIDKYCYISCRELPPFFSHNHRIVYSKIENAKTINQIQHPVVKAILKKFNVKKGLEIHHDGDLPAKSGIGSSSSFTVGMLNALYAMANMKVTKFQLANQAIFLEQKTLKENVGSQDQIAAAYGGFNYIQFNKNSTFEILENNFQKKNIENIEESIVLCYTSLSRISGHVAKKKLSNFKVKKIKFEKLNYLTLEADKLLSSKNFILKDFAKLVTESWMIKKSLANEVSNNYIDEIFEFSLKNGALGGKLLGAGAGGFLMFIISKNKKKEFINKMKKLICFGISFDNKGSQILNLK
tara:strand:+ start:7786 stop:8769 length:984 start_codon:yes stop_codon:yes gene_type:complete